VIQNTPGKLAYTSASQSQFTYREIWQKYFCKLRHGPKWIYYCEVLSSQKVLFGTGRATRRWSMYFPIRRSLPARPEPDNTFWDDSTAVQKKDLKDTIGPKRWCRVRSHLKELCLLVRHKHDRYNCPLYRGNSSSRNQLDFHKT